MMELTQTQGPGKEGGKGRRSILAHEVIGCGKEGGGELLFFLYAMANNT